MSTVISSQYRYYFSLFCVPTGHADSSVVEAVMKMWPPPAAPKDRDPEKEAVPRGSSYVNPQGPSSSSSYEGKQPIRSSSRATDQPGLQRVLGAPGQLLPAAVTTNTPRPPGYTSTDFCLTLSLFILV